MLDLWGQLNDVGSLISGLFTIAKYHALRTGLDKAVAKDDWVGAVECLNALTSLQLTPKFDRVFENVDDTTYESPKKDPERATAEQEPLPPESGIDALTGEEAEALLAMLDEKFNGK